MRTRGRWALGGFSVLLIALAPAAAQTPVLSVSGAGQPSSFGYDADAIGDWDGDGIADVAIGVPYVVLGADPPGTVRIVSGHDASLLALFSGTLPKQEFGRLVAGAGDVDADGVVDVAVGSVPNFGSAPTTLHVFSGATGAMLLDEEVAPFTLFALDGAGDVNADGYADIVKGGFGCSEGTVGGSLARGDATVFSGATGDVIFTACGDGSGDHFGVDVAAASDVNLDGYADIVVGASESDNFSPEGNGYVRVLSGFDGATLYTFEGPSFYNNGFGETVDGAGDVNGDGWPDIVVGARQEKLDELFMGSASVYSGFDGSVLHHVPGTIANKQFGAEVAGPGDLDGDGFGDFAVLTSHLDAPGAPQYGYVVHSGADAAALQLVPLGPAVLAFSIDLSAAGDLNADGTPDLLMVTGQPSAPNFSTVTVRSGAPVLFTDLGFALPGSQGTPHLQIEGVLHKGLPLTLSVTDAPPLAPLFLVVGGAATPVPFHGGVLVPVPQALIVLATDAAGAFTAGTKSPALLPGTQFVVQGWLPDAPAPNHVAATNAVLGVAP
jgi:hypothetical protein